MRVSVVAASVTLGDGDGDGDVSSMIMTSGAERRARGGVGRSQLATQRRH
jgi:hypothetical protein